MRSEETDDDKFTITGLNRPQNVHGFTIGTHDQRALFDLLRLSLNLRANNFRINPGSDTNESRCGNRQDGIN